MLIGFIIISQEYKLSPEPTQLVAIVVAVRVAVGVAVRELTWTISLICPYDLSIHQFGLSSHEQELRKHQSHR